MQDDNSIPTWEMPPGAKPETVSEADSERAEAFENAMSDVEFSGDDNAEQNENNEGISAASSIVKYGANAACSKIGVQGVVDAIENFDPSGYDDPISAFYDTLGIENSDDLNATMEREKENLDPTVSKQNFSQENFVQALSDFKELVSEVKSDPRFSELNNAASSFGTTVFNLASQRAAEKGGKPDFVGALMELRAQKRAMEEAEKLGVGSEGAAKIAVGDKPDQEVPEGYDDPESDEQIRIHELLEKKTEEAEKLFLYNKELFSDDEQEDLEKTIRDAKDAVEGKTVNADKKNLLKDIEELIEKIKDVKFGGNSPETESEEAES